jgi:hypothetical protein
MSSLFLSYWKYTTRIVAGQIFCFDISSSRGNKTHTAVLLLYVYGKYTYYFNTQIQALWKKQLKN